MNFDRTVNFITRTDGQGYWSNAVKTVRVTRIMVEDNSGNGEYGELRAVFDVKDWDIDVDGLIYSDQGWKRSFISCMATLGFSVQALADISYSEQGMQGETYVSMDVGRDFLLECTPLFRFVIAKEAVN